VPSRPEHLTRAAENEALSKTLDLDNGCQADWAVTMLFYAALHYIDAFLAGKHLHPRDHDIRDSEVENNGSLSPIYNDYRRLKDNSIAARYEIANFHRANLPPIEARYDRVKSHVRRLMP
jgi:hypothetical protein